MSFDPPQVNAKFKQNNNFQYELWTDQAKELALHYGGAKTKTQLFADRVTVVLDSKGHWLLTYASIPNATKHPSDVLSDCQKVFGTE